MKARERRRTRGEVNLGMLLGEAPGSFLTKDLGRAVYIFGIALALKTFSRDVFLHTERLRRYQISAVLL